MSDRNSSNWTVWWTSADGQGCMWNGDFSSREEAIAALPAIIDENIGQCSCDEEKDSLMAGHWDLQAPADDDDSFGAFERLHWVS
jgi:hypothetical protein